MIRRATAAAHPNLALVKYWGKTNDLLNLPTNSSISVNLDGAKTETTVEFRAELAHDCMVLNGQVADLDTLARVTTHLDLIRSMAGIETRALIESANDFPSAAGIASSSSAFAALSLAASHAAGLDLDPRQLSRLARRGSGSAARSIPGGFVEWVKGELEEESYAFQLAPPDHWDLVIYTVIVDSKPKAISSTTGHRAAWSSPFFERRLELLPGTLDRVRRSLINRDFQALAQFVEREAVSMHAVAITSCIKGTEWLSGLYYWGPHTLSLIHAVQEWRFGGLDVCFTIDAGPNVHLLCEAASQARLEESLVPLVDKLEAGVIVSRPGPGVWLVAE